MKKTMNWVFLFSSFLVGGCLVIAVLWRWHATEPKSPEQRPSGGATEHLMSRDEAKRVISEYAASAKFEPNTGLSPEGVPGIGLVWPEISPKVARALKAMEGVKDLDVAADSAALIVRFENELRCDYVVSGLSIMLGGGVTEPFYSALKPLPMVMPTGECYSMEVVEWICKNRDKLGKSATLDHEIEVYTKKLWKMHERHPGQAPELDPRANALAD